MIKIIKRRYIAFRLMSRTKTSKIEIYKALLRNMSIRKNGGREYKPYFRIIEYDEETGLGIIRCGHNSVGQLLHSIREADWMLKELKMKTLGTSGTIKALKRKFLSKEF